MYVKMFVQILDGSLADNRRLRHFFMDLLLCADQEGNVMKTKSAIAHAIRADIEEVEWGLAELMKPDDMSGTPDFEGRRVVALVGRPYGWKIVNYEAYRDMKSAKQMREQTAQRVRECRARKTGKADAPKGKKTAKERKLPGESAFVGSVERGEPREVQDRIVDGSFKEGVFDS